jgi:hypothetical protein
MKIAIAIVFTLILISVITILLIKKSVKTQDTSIDWLALANGNLTVSVKFNLLLPFAVTLENVELTLGAGGTNYFGYKNPELKLNPGLNVLSINLSPIKPLDVVGVAFIATQKKYVNIKGTVLGLSFERTEDLKK